MPLNVCDAAIRPMPDREIEIHCGRVGLHDEHTGPLRDYAYPGSETAITWHEGDRRNFHLPWPGDCPQPTCPLPQGHWGRHAD
jgi:hypothetical protein